jgi:hypothetical protein
MGFPRVAEDGGAGDPTETFGGRIPDHNAVGGIDDNHSVPHLL